MPFAGWVMAGEAGLDFCDDDAYFPGSWGIEFE